MIRKILKEKDMKNHISFGFLSSSVFVGEAKEPTMDEVIGEVEKFAKAAKI